MPQSKGSAQAVSGYAGLKFGLKFYAAVYITGMFYWCVLTGNAVLRDALATEQGEMKGEVISVPKVKLLTWLVYISGFQVEKQTMLAGASL